VFVKLDFRELEPHQFVDVVLKHAVERGASDLYWIPVDKGLEIRLRVQHRPEPLAVVPAVYGAQCVTRLKVLAGMLTYRTLVAQDGAFSLADRKNFPDWPDALREVACRVSVLPSTHGERVTIRIRREAEAACCLDELGMTSEVLNALRRLLRRPTGMIILTGPTGSGKTTTIYAMLKELLKWNDDPASLITIEDPVESELAGVTQVSVTGGEDSWDYAAALRASLRHDVKTIAIGEIRDRHVAKVALEAALTGHRVITTFHAGDIPSVYARLLHLGFEPFLIAAAVSGIVTQRLVPRADGTGLMPVVALLEADDAWRERIVQRPDLTSLKQAVQTNPQADLKQVAQALVASGVIDRTELILV
jgi:type II secretory ATPase GspE/PulE/Tfp pilus assembly ATPase PilB-like protein